MKVKSLAPWFGGKRSMAPVIVTELGPHIQYFEPFAASLAVLLGKPESRHETVSDLHGDATNLARVIQDEATAIPLYERLQRTVVCDGLLKDAQCVLAESPASVEGRDPERAYWFFVASWMARNGTAGTASRDYQLAVRWTHGGGSPTVRFRSATDSLPAWHRRLLNVVVLTRDAFEIIPRFQDDAHTAIYVDPPYISESRTSWSDHGGAHSGKYLHDFNAKAGGIFDGGDEHERLRDQLAAFQHARVVVSYYDCPRVRQLYDGWTFVDCSRNKNLHQQNGRGARKAEAPEVLIANGPSLAGATP